MKPIDECVRTFMEQHRIPGAALAVTDQGRLVLARGYGYADVAAKKQVTPTSPFRIASISKPITAVAVMRLAERGEIDLDDPVSAHLDPHDAKRVDGATEATWRGLLQHTAGIPDYPGNVAFTLDLFQRLVVATASVSAVAYGPTAPTVLTANATGDGLGVLFGR